MKIVIVCGAGVVSGKEIISLELAEALLARNEEITVVTSVWASADFIQRLRSRRIRYYRFRLGYISATMTFDNIRMTMHQLIYYPKLLVDYWAFLRRERPDRVIHTNWHHLLLLTPLLRPSRDVFWVHDCMPQTPRYRRLFALFSRRLRGFVTVSAAVAKSIRGIGAPESQIRLIHNGIADPAEGAPRSVADRGEVAIGIVGQIAAWKGHEDLLKAFASLAREFPQTRLQVFGNDDRPFAAELIRQAAQAGVAARIVWRGFVRDRKAIYSLLDICAIPSRAEDPFPTTAIEAAFFGLPVVATRRGGLPEIVVEGVTGFLVNSERPAELAARLRELIADEELRRRFGAAARDRAATHFTRARMGEDFELYLHNGAEFRALGDHAEAETVA
jgi:glycosyltransferase involved in cell wall biosynthesis